LRPFLFLLFLFREIYTIYFTLSKDAKAYASKANREMLLMKGFKDGILHKALKNKPLRVSQKKFNKLISKTRFVMN
jgi:IS5 family transposase